MRWFRKVRDYIRYDLKEILNPSSLPDPPGTPQYHRLSFKEWIAILQDAGLNYIDSWRKNPRRPIHQKCVCMEEEDSAGSKRDPMDDRNTLQEFGHLLKAGRRDFRSVIQKLYYSRGRVLTKAVRSFAEGFHEGLNEAKTKSKPKS